MGKQYLNGVLYGTGEIIKFSPDVYSTEEREVGVFTDGKPLYQKSYNIVPTAASDSVDISALSVDKVIQIFGTATRNGVQQKQISYRTEIAGYDNYGISCEVSTQHNQLSYYIAGYTYSEINEIRVTLQYTKTTDLPGSGNYTTQGTEAHHYSTTEQIVGTWIDGGTLYEKTFSTTATTIPMNSSIIITYADYGLTNLNSIVDCDISVYVNGSFGAFLPYMENSYEIKYSIEPTFIKIYRAGSSLPNASFVVTLKYTKTT